MNAIILHGTCDKEEYYSSEFPSMSNSHWVPRLQNQLLIHGIEAHTPEMFEAYKPNYELWKIEFEKNKVDENTILVGHSCGGGFIVRWLSENFHVIPKKVILVAPWLDPESSKKNNFFDFKIQPNIKDSNGKITIFESTNDSGDVQESIKILQNVLENSVLKTFKNYGHFCYNDFGTQEFPELLKEVLNF